MIMVIKMRLHTKFDGLSILELRVPMPWSATFDRRYTPFFLFLSLFFPSLFFAFSFLSPIFQHFHQDSMSIYHYLLLFIWKFGGPRLRDMEAGTFCRFIFLQFTRFVMAEYNFISSICNINSRGLAHSESFCTFSSPETQEFTGLPGPISGAVHQGLCHSLVLRLANRGT